MKSAYVERLRDECRQAREQIVGNFRSGAVRPKGTRKLYAWGQYLGVVGQAPETDLGDHYGIYGTSAAVQVLALQSVGHHRSLICDGVKVLPLVAPAPESKTLKTIQGYFEKKGDLLIVYKLCAVLDAAIVLTEAHCPTEWHVDPRPILEKLLEMRHDTAGWPDFANETMYQGSNAHATAAALLSISRGSIEEETAAACREAFVWFANLPLEDHSIATIAMVVCAIHKFRVSKLISDSKDIEHLLRKSEGAVEKWVKLTSPTEVRRSLEATEYWLPSHSHPEQPVDNFRFAFLLYLPHCLAALAVLDSPHLRKSHSCREFVLQTVGLVAERARSHGHFVAAGRQMISTVEHLWLYRLLHAFETQEKFYLSSRAIVYDRVSERRWGRLVTVLVAIATVGLAVAAALTEGTLQAALEAISVVSLAIVSALIVTYVRRLS